MLTKEESEEIQAYMQAKKAKAKDEEMKRQLEEKKRREAIKERLLALEMERKQGYVRIP